MLFNSHEFLIVFLPITLLLFYCTPKNLRFIKIETHRALSNLSAILRQTD